MISYDIKDKSNLPTNIYLLLDYQRVVYIGQTKSLGTRINSHIKSGKRFNKAINICFPSEYNKYIDEIERHLIVDNNPKYNKVFNSLETTDIYQRAIDNKIEQMRVEDIKFIFKQENMSKISNEILNSQYHFIFRHLIHR